MSLFSAYDFSSSSTSISCCSLLIFPDARKAERAANDSLYHFCWDCSSSSLNASRDLAASCSVETFAFCSFSAADFASLAAFSAFFLVASESSAGKRLLYISWAISTYSPAASLLFFIQACNWTFSILLKFWRASASFCWFLTVSSIVWPFSCFNFSSAPRMRSPYFFISCSICGRASVLMYAVGAANMPLLWKTVLPPCFCCSNRFLYAWRYSSNCSVVSRMAFWFSNFSSALCFLRNSSTFSPEISMAFPYWSNAVAAPGTMFLIWAMTLANSFCSSAEREDLPVSSSYRFNSPGNALSSCTILSKWFS